MPVSDRGRGARMSSVAGARSLARAPRASRVCTTTSRRASTSARASRPRRTPTTLNAASSSTGISRRAAGACRSPPSAPPGGGQRRAWRRRARPAVRLTAIAALRQPRSGRRERRRRWRARRRGAAPLDAVLERYCDRGGPRLARGPDAQQAGPRLRRRPRASAISVAAARGRARRRNGIPLRSRTGGASRLRAAWSGPRVATVREACAIRRRSDADRPATVRAPSTVRPRRRRAPARANDGRCEVEASAATARGWTRTRRRARLGAIDASRRFPRPIGRGSRRPRAARAGPRRGAREQSGEGIAVSPCAACEASSRRSARRALVGSSLSGRAFFTKFSRSSNGSASVGLRRSPTRRHREPSARVASSRLRAARRAQCTAPRLRSRRRPMLERRHCGVAARGGAARARFRETRAARGTPRKVVGEVLGDAAATGLAPRRAGELFDAGRASPLGRASRLRPPSLADARAKAPVGGHTPRVPSSTTTGHRKRRARADRAAASPLPSRRVLDSVLAALCRRVARLFGRGATCARHAKTLSATHAKTYAARRAKPLPRPRAAPRARYACAARARSPTPRAGSPSRRCPNRTALASRTERSARARVAARLPVVRDAPSRTARGPAAGPRRLCPRPAPTARRCNFSRRALTGAGALIGSAPTSAPSASSAATSAAGAPPPSSRVRRAPASRATLEHLERGGLERERAPKSRGSSRVEETDRLPRREVHVRAVTGGGGLPAGLPVNDRGRRPRARALLQAEPRTDDRAAVIEAAAERADDCARSTPRQRWPRPPRRRARATPRAGRNAAPRGRRDAAGMSAGDNILAFLAAYRTAGAARRAPASDRATRVARIGARRIVDRRAGGAHDHANVREVAALTSARPPRRRDSGRDARFDSEMGTSTAPAADVRASTARARRLRVDGRVLVAGGGARARVRLLAPPPVAARPSRAPRGVQVARRGGPRPCRRPILARGGGQPPRAPTPTAALRATPSH